MIKIVLDKRFNESNLKELEEQLSSFDKNITENIRLVLGEVNLKYATDNNAFFINVKEDSKNDANYEIDNLTLALEKNQYVIKKNEIAIKKLTAINEEALYTLNNNPEKDYSYLQYAVKIICEYAREKNIDKKLNINYTTGVNGFNEFIPIFTNFFNKQEIIQRKKNEKIGLLIPKTANNELLQNAIEIYKEANLKTFLLKENFLTQIAEESFNFYNLEREKQNLKKILVFEQLEKNNIILSKDSFIVANDILFKYLLDKENKKELEDNLFRPDNLIELLDFVEKYKSSKTYECLKNIMNNIETLDDYLKNEDRDFLAFKINDFISNTPIQMIMAQKLEETNDNNFKQKFKKLGEIFAFSDDDKKTKKDNYILYENKTNLQDIINIRVVRAKNYEEPKSFFDLSGVDKQTAENILQSVTNSVIVSDYLLSESVPAFKKDNKFYHYQYNKYQNSEINIVGQKIKCNNYEDINDVLLALGNKQRKTAFEVATITNERSFLNFNKLLNEEKVINEFLQSKKAKKNILEIVTSENRKIIPTSIKSSYAIRQTSTFTKNAKKSEELQDNLYIKESKNIFSVLKPQERTKESITFAGNGFTRNSVFPIFLSISEKEEKEKIIEVFNKAADKYIEDLKKSDLAVDFKITELEARIKKQISEIVTNDNNKQLSISIKQAILDNLVIPIEFLKAINEFGQFSDEIPLPSNYFYNELESQNIINKNTMLTIPKIKNEEKLFCIEKTLANNEELLNEIGKKEEIKNKLNELQNESDTLKVEEISKFLNEYVNSIYIFSSFESVLKTLDKNSLDLVENFLNAKKIEIDNDKTIINIEDFDELNQKLKKELKEKYFKYEERLANFIKDNQLKHRMKDIIAKSLINCEKLEMLHKGYNNFNNLQKKADEKYPNNNDTIEMYKEDKYLNDILKYLKLKTNERIDDFKTIEDLKGAITRTKDSYIQKGFTENFKQKFSQINGLKQHQIDTMFSSLLKPDNTINLNFSARAGKTLTSLSTLLVANKDKAEFYGQQKNLQDILWQFYNFLPDYAHKMKFKVTTIEDTKYKFLPQNRMLSHFENDGYLLNIPEILKELLNKEKSINKDGPFTIIKGEYYNKINMIKVYLEDTKTDIKKYLKQTGAIKLLDSLKELEKKYNSPVDNTKMLNIMTMYFHSLIKEKFLLVENINEAVERISNAYEKNILVNIENNEVSYLTIGNRNAISKIINNNNDGEKIQESITYTTQKGGLTYGFSTNGFMLDFEKNYKEQIYANSDDIKSFVNKSRNLLEKFDFASNSDIKKAGDKQEIIVIVKKDNTKKLMELFINSVEEIEKRINKNFAKNIITKIKENNNLKDNKIDEIQMVNILSIINKEFQNNNSSLYFNFLESLEKDLSSEKDLNNINIAINDILSNGESVDAYKVKIDNEKIENYIKTLEDTTLIKNLINLGLLSSENLNEIAKETLDAKTNNLACFRQVIGSIFLPEIIKDKFVIKGKDKLGKLFNNTKTEEIKIRYREKNTENNIFNSFSLAPCSVSNNGKTVFFNYEKAQAVSFQPNADNDKVDITDADYELVLNKKATITILKNNNHPLISKNNIDFSDNTALYYQEDSQKKKIVALDEYHKDTGPDANYGKATRKNIVNAKNIQPILITATPVRQEFKDLSMKQIDNLGLKLLFSLKQYDLDNKLEKVIKEELKKDKRDIFAAISKIFDEKKFINCINEILIYSNEQQYSISNLENSKLQALEYVFKLNDLIENMKNNLNKEKIINYENLNIFDFDFLEHYLDNEFLKTKQHIPTTQVIYANLNLENDEQFSIINSLPFAYNIIDGEAKIEDKVDFITTLVAVQKYYSFFNVNNSLSTLNESIFCFREAFNKNNKNQYDEKIIEHNISNINEEIKHNAYLRYFPNMSIKEFWSSDNKTVPDDGLSIIKKLYLEKLDIESCIKKDFTKESEKRISDKYRIAIYLIENYLDKMLSNSNLQSKTIGYQSELKYFKTFFDGSTKEVKLSNENREEQNFYFTKINNILIPIYISNNNKTIKDLNYNMGFEMGNGLFYNDINDSTPKKHYIKTDIKFNFDKTCFEYFFPKLSEIIDFDKISIFPTYEIKPKIYKTFEALNILYEENLRDEIKKNIKENKYFPIFTDRDATHTMATLFVLDELLKKNNEKMERVVITFNNELKNIIPAIDENKLNDANIDLIGCKDAGETHKVLFSLNKINADPKIMIFSKRKVAEGFQIQKISHDKDTFMIFANSQECAMNLSATCQALSRADCINAREEQKAINKSKIFNIQAKFFGVKTEIKNFNDKIILEKDMLKLFKDGIVKLEDKNEIVELIKKCNGKLSYSSSVNSFIKIKAYTDFYQDNFRDTLTTNPEFAKRTLPTVLQTCNIYELKNDRKLKNEIEATEELKIKKGLKK